MEFNFTNGFALGLLTVGSYYSYFFVRSKIQNYIIGEVMKKLNEKASSDPTFDQINDSKSSILRYNQGGKKFNLCILYDQTKASLMRGKEVYLVGNVGDNGDSFKTVITHKPGIPYLLSAKNMGGTKIIVEKRNRIIKEYINDEVPNYLEDTETRFVE